MHCRLVVVAAFAACLSATPIGAVRALTLAESTVVAEDPLSGGQIEIVSTVIDNFQGDFSKREFRYTITNLSFDPEPGVSNGLSAFATGQSDTQPYPEDIFGPAAWTLVEIFPPLLGNLGTGWEIPDGDGFGIPIGGSDTFGYSSRLDWGECNLFPFACKAATFEGSITTNEFFLVDVSDGRGILVPTPEPGSASLVALGLAGLSIWRRRVTRRTSVAIRGIRTAGGLASRR